MSAIPTVPDIRGLDQYCRVSAWVKPQTQRLYQVDLHLRFNIKALTFWYQTLVSIQKDEGYESSLRAAASGMF